MVTLVPLFVAAKASFQTGVGPKATQEVKIFLPYNQVPGWKSEKGGSFKLCVGVWSDVYQEMLRMPLKVEHSFRSPVKAVAAR
jgi:hypothetical protein